MGNFLADFGAAVPAITQMQHEAAVTKAAQQEAVIRNFQIKKLEEQEAELNRPIPLESVQQKFAGAPEVGKKFMETLQAQPDAISTVGGRQFTTKKHLNMIGDSLKQDHELIQTHIQSQYDQALQESIATQQALTEAQRAGDPNKLQKLQVQAQQADERLKQMNMSLHKFDLMKLETQQQAKQQKGTWMIGADGRPINVPNTPGAAPEGAMLPQQWKKENAEEKLPYNKPSADDARIVSSLKSKLGREPTDQEFLDAKAVWNGQKSGERAKATRDAKLVLSPADRRMAEEVAGGRLAPSQLSKRTDNYNAVLAEAFNINPDFDAKLSDTEKQLLGNQAFRTKGMNLAVIPELLNGVTAAGKALKYDEVQFIGKLEQWKNGQLNDPQFVQYMTMRNDIILRLAATMRGASATDQSQRLEEEAFKPTLSPDALDGWLKGQLAVARPMIEEFEKTIGGRNISSGAQPPQQMQPKTSKPSFSEFLSRARAANPEYSDAEIRAIYDQKYGGN